MLNRQLQYTQQKCALAAILHSPSTSTLLSTEVYLVPVCRLWHCIEALIDCFNCVICSSVICG